MFRIHEDNGNVICNKVLTNSSMAPGKLGRHLESVHGELKAEEVMNF